jgi:hypothetical protein
VSEKDEKRAKIVNAPLGKGRKVTKEKIEFKGDFRIVGTVWSGSNEVGYAVIDVKTYTLKLFTKVQTSELLKRYTFENAELIDGKILNTECSMQRLLKFDSKSNVIGNRGITILGEILIGTKVLGYRAMDAEGKVTDIKEADLIVVSRRFAGGIINGKIVSGTNGEYVSAIKTTFKRIEKIPVSFVEETKKVIGTTAERNKKFYDKALKYFIISVVHNGGINVRSALSKKRAKIMLKEFVLVDYPQFKVCTEARVENILTAAIVLYVARTEIGGYLENLNKQRQPTKPLGEKKTTTLVFKNYHHQNKRYNLMEPKVLEVVKNITGSEDAFNYLSLRNEILDSKIVRVKKNPVINTTLNVSLTSFKSELAVAYVLKEKIAKRTFFSTAEIDYRDVSGLAAFGYTIDKSQVGLMNNSPIYGDRPLRYLFGDLDIHPDQEQFLLDNIQCFGDIELTRKIIHYYTEGSPIKSKWAECLFFILVLNNPEIAKFVLEYGFGPLTYDIDKVSNEDFYLNSDDELYYLSGGKFNKHVVLQRNKSWEGLDEIPQSTYEAICMHLGASESNELPRSTEDIRRWEWQHRDRS